MDDTINDKTINKRFNAKESNYKTSAPIIGNSPSINSSFFKSIFIFYLVFTFTGAKFFIQYK